MKYSEKIYNWFFILFTGVLFSYILIRSSQFSFSEDEAFSLLDVLYMNFGYFFGSTPNTHLVNSFFLWLGVKSIGFHEIALRFHSVVSFLVFAWVVYKISGHIQDLFHRFLFVLVISLHPFMLTYFSMARGYAMSIAFMMISLYFLYEGILPGDRKNKLKLYTASFWASLTVVSCYVMFTFYLAVLLFYGFYCIIQNGSLKKMIPEFWKEKIFWTTHLLFTLGIMYLVLKLRPSSLHEFWPYNSFWGDTIYSLSETFFWSPHQYVKWLFVLFVGMITFSCSVSLIRFYRMKEFSADSLFTVLFVIIALLLAFQYYGFNITYISYRGAIFLYPLIVLMFFRMLKESSFSVSLQVVGKPLLYLYSFVVIVNFFFTFSYQEGIGIVSREGFIRALQDLKVLKSEGKEVSLGVSRAFPATICYYKLKYELTWIKNIGMGYESDEKEYLFYGMEKIKTGNYDYFILEEPDIPIVSRHQKIVILEKYPESRIVLAKPFD